MQYRKARLDEVQEVAQVCADAFEDYPYLLRNKFNQNHFFLRPGYIVIYYQQYEIAPYATGIPEFSIPIPANQITTRR